MKILHCSWCEGDIRGEYIRYHGGIFCRDNDDKCIKEYLFEKHYGEFEIDETELEYDMSKVEEKYLT